MHGALLLSVLLGCGPRERVAWDALDAEDTVEDIAVGLVLFGVVRETDRMELVGPHVAGGTLLMQAESRGRDASGWRVEVLDPSIVTATILEVHDDFAIDVELHFLTEGTTDLFVIDDDGAVLDVQSLRVRAPVAAELVPWEELQVAQAASVQAKPLPEGPIHTVHGADVDFALTWLDQADTRLMGGQLLTIDGDIPAGVSTQVLFTGELDVLRMGVEPRTRLGTFTVELYAADILRATQDLFVHGADEVDAVQLEIAVGAGFEQEGAARAVVLAGDDALVGAPVRFQWEDRSEVGTVLLFHNDGSGASTPVTACFEGPEVDVCTESTVPGIPTGVADRTADEACGCQATPRFRPFDWLRRRRHTYMP
jgi:hypothetical protein